MAQPCWRRRELPWEKRLLALRLSHIRRPKSSGQNPVVRGRHGISATSQSSTCENSRTARCKKHGNTLIGTLRKTYGPHFAKGCADDDKLSDVLHKLDEPSLSALVEDHAAAAIPVSAFVWAQAYRFSQRLGPRPGRGASPARMASAPPQTRQGASA